MATVKVTAAGETATVTYTPPVTTGTYANASNTGPKAAGFNPTKKYTGPMRITTAGTVIKNMVIPAGLVISANNVTIQGNIVSGPTNVSSDQAAIEVDASNCVIVDNQINGLSSTDWKQCPISGVKLYGDNLIFSRNNCFNIAGDGITIDGENFTGIGNWVHDFVLRSGGVHYDGFHYPKPTKVKTKPALIQDNRVEMWIPVGVSDSGMTTALGIPEETGSGALFVVNHNVIAGGGYAIEGGHAGATISNNLFWTKFSPNCGYYGVSSPSFSSGAKFVGNKYTTDGVTPTTPYSP